jgi:hypothetical protein
MENPWPGKKVILFRNGKRTGILQGNVLKFSTSKDEKIEITPVPGEQNRTRNK